MVNSIGIAKRTVAGVATVALLAAQFVVAPLASAATFSDVPADHFAAPFVSDLSAMGVMTGYADGTFKPNAFLNRAEMAKIAVKLAVITKVVASETDSAGAPTFSDVNSGEWYAQYVAVSAKNKIFEGYKDANGMLTGKFGPADMVTRAQAAKVLLKSAGIMDKLSPAAPFVDVNPSDWFYNYVTTAYNWSILDGYKDANSNLTGYFGPNDYVTRGQIAKIAMKSKSPVDRATGAASNSNGNMMNSNTANNNGNMMSANVNSSIPPSKVAFEAAVSPSSPAAGTLVTGTAYNTVAKVDLTAGSDEDVKITSLTVIHRGVSQSSVINGVMVMDKDGMRHGNIVSFADSKAVINLASNPIIVKAGTTHTASILVNFNTITDNSFSSGTFGVEVPTSGVSAIGATTGGAVTVKGTFPLVWPVFPLVKGDSIGNAKVDAIQISTSLVDVDLGEKGREVSKFKITQENGKEDVKIYKATFFNNGNVADTDIENIQLVDQTGKVLSTVKNTSNRYVTFDLSAAPYLLPKGSSRNFSIKVDIAANSNGSTRTTQFVLSNDYDVMVKGENSQAYLLPTFVTGGIDTTFPIGDAANFNTIRIKEGTLTLSRATTSPNGEIARGSSDVVVAEFKVEAAGEDIEIQGGTFNLDAGATCVTSTDANYFTKIVKGTFKLTTADGSTIHSLTASDTANCPVFNTTYGDAVETISRFNNFYVVKGGTAGVIK